MNLRVTWKIFKQAYKLSSKRCTSCIREKYFIIPESPIQPLLTSATSLQLRVDTLTNFCLETFCQIPIQFNIISTIHNIEYTISQYRNILTYTQIQISALIPLFLSALILKHTFKSVIGPVKGSKRANTRLISWRTVLQCLQFGTFE